jgi:hypothetical protein
MIAGAAARGAGRAANRGAQSLKIRPKMLFFTAAPHCAMAGADRIK